MFHWFRKHTIDGLELPDPTPKELPLGLKRPLTLAEQIARLTRDDLIQSDLRRNGVETFEESQDFDMDDDDPSERTPYEAEFNGSELPVVQTHLDESRSGMVEEFPHERKQLSRFVKPKAQAPVAPITPKSDVPVQ